MVQQKMMQGPRGVLAVFQHSSITCKTSQNLQHSLMQIPSVFREASSVQDIHTQVPFLFDSRGKMGNVAARTRDKRTKRKSSKSVFFFVLLVSNKKYHFFSILKNNKMINKTNLQSIGSVFLFA